MRSSALAAGIRHLRGKLASQQRHEDSDEQLLHAFLNRRDEAAFAVLVRRHGPMVLHVCRRVLGHRQDAEDAFQAAFLVLARNAAALRKKSALASFLHGTAYRLALKAKQSAARRRKHEGRTPPRPTAEPSAELLWDEVRTILDEEIARLPEKYRIVFVLSHLEGLGREETARRLGLKPGTVASRLAEARKRLQRRLARRGVELTAVLGAAALATPSDSALPAGLIAKTTQTALAAATGDGLAGAVSAAVAELVKGGASIATMSKAKMATALLLTASLLTGAGLWASRGPTVPSAAPPQPATKERAADRPKPRTPRQEKRQTVEVRGQVLGPDSKPVRGAKLLFIYGSGKKYPHKVWAVSSAEGRFAFTVAVKDVDNGYSEKPWEGTYVVAAAEGYGFAAARLGKPGAADLTLRLVKDDVPIRGRVLNLEGKPVDGVRVRIADMLRMPQKGDLTAWLAALKAKKDNPGTIDANYLTWLYNPAFDLLFPPVTTGADGCFEMKGIGRERIAHLRIEGPRIATQEVWVMTRANEKVRLPVQKEYPKRQSVTYHGTGFDLLATPSRLVVGVVRDRDTGKPLAGVTVESGNAFRSDFIRTTTDKDGRYQLDGLPKGDGNEIAATIRSWLTDLPMGDGKEIAAATNELPYLTVLGPDGKPLTGARISGLKDMGYWEENAGTDFMAESLKPNKPRLLQFLHEGQKLSGYLVVRGDEKGPLRVQLKPWGTLTGRVVTPLGNPLTSVRVNCRAEVKHKGRAIPSTEVTVFPGKDGRFRIEGLIAGVKYELSVSRANVLETISGGNPKDLTIESGATKDLGELKVKPMEQPR